MKQCRKGQVGDEVMDLAQNEECGQSMTSGQ
jgi:hypothetical protein